MKNILISLLSVYMTAMLFSTVNGQSYTSGTSTVVTPSGSIVVGTVRTGFQYDSPVTNTVKQPIVQQPSTSSYGSQGISVYYEKSTITLNKQPDGPRYSESTSNDPMVAQRKKINKIQTEGAWGEGRYIPTDKRTR